MRIVLLGSPASGKGTQGRRIAASLGLGYLSTGVLLRENIIGRTELGLAANVALRLEKSIEWDGPGMKVPSLPDADRYIHKENRSLWL